MSVLTNAIKLMLSSSLAVTSFGSYITGNNLNRKNQEETNEIEDVGE